VWRLVWLVMAMSAVARAEPASDANRVGVGLLAGMSSERDAVGGARGVFHLLDAGPGTVRAIAQLLYARWRDPADAEHRWDVVATSVAVEYAAPVSPPFFVAIGGGLGYDIVKDNYDHPRTGHAFAAGRISPTLRVGGVDVGLHLQLVYSDRVSWLGELGVDYYIK
jgi:hypothetical protein